MTARGRVLFGLVNGNEVTLSCCAHSILWLAYVSGRRHCYHMVCFLFWPKQRKLIEGCFGPRPTKCRKSAKRADSCKSVLVMQHRRTGDGGSMMRFPLWVWRFAWQRFKDPCVLLHSGRTSNLPGPFGRGSPLLQTPPPPPCLLSSSQILLVYDSFRFLQPNIRQEAPPRDPASLILSHPTSLLLFDIYQKDADKSEKNRNFGLHFFSGGKFPPIFA